MNSEMSNLIIAICVILTVVGIVAGVFFLLTLQRALQLCAPQNRTMAPGKVWLCFIPLFGLVWIFVVISRVASSLRLEFESRQAPPEDYGRSIGLAYCILAVISIIPIIGVLTGLASTVCWIIYWVKISTYSSRLQGDGRAVPEDPEVEQPYNPGKAWTVLLILILAYAGQHLQTLAFSWFLPTLRDQLRLSSLNFSDIFSAYMVGLMAGYGLMTIVTALCGTRWGLVVALAGASLAAASVGLPSSLAGMILARATLGFFAGGILPAAIQSLRENFPSPMRPLAIGLFFASTPLLALLTSPLTHLITTAIGWRLAFMITGIPTVIAAALCWFFWLPPTRTGGSRGVTGMGVVSVVMLGVGFLLAAPLYSFAQSWLPIFVLRGRGAPLTTFSTINLAASVSGPILAGVVAWAMMEAEISAWKTRAALLTFFGLILAVTGFGGIYARGWLLAAVSALLLGAFEGWSTLLYTAVADTLPARGVCIGVAIGALMMELVMMLFNLVTGSVMNEYGMGFAFGFPAALAVGGLICISLLAWLVHPKPAILPADTPVAI